MTREQLFNKYSIDESHSEWDDQIDNWVSVEVYRIMHNGDLPPNEDMSVRWVTEFLDKVNSDELFMAELATRKENDLGDLYLTAKRMVYSFADQLLKPLKI